MSKDALSELNQISNIIKENSNKIICFERIKDYVDKRIKLLEEKT